ncbi:hypothetical protein [Arthrobacter sp. Cr_A7]|uniref:IS1096 element passenger TnpR family protein n=1 Tax=Arthrobacter sp. Cr_A7 TaxID=3031017 RepID=UPI0023DB0964|nr:hypothetical protein [Arthrobacter sp. Cr_A7]MDF2049578.1 hypothetical protein [Arthrobacter sp. Cr_A7]
MLLQVKVWIVGSEPAIWRLLEIAPSLTLDEIHGVIQTAVGWRDSHLHGHRPLCSSARRQRARPRTTSLGPSGSAGRQ